MEVTLKLSEGQEAEIVAAVVAEMVSLGIAVAPPERERPFTVEEAAGELGVSTSAVRREVDAGRLARVPNTGRVLIPVWSVRARQRGEADASVLVRDGKGVRGV